MELFEPPYTANFKGLKNTVVPVPRGMPSTFSLREIRRKFKNLGSLGAMLPKIG